MPAFCETGFPRLRLPSLQSLRHGAQAGAGKAEAEAEEPLGAKAFGSGSADARAIGRSDSHNFHLLKMCYFPLALAGTEHWKYVVACFSRGLKQMQDAAPLMCQTHRQGPFEAGPEAERFSRCLPPKLKDVIVGWACLFFYPFWFHFQPAPQQGN